MSATAAGAPRRESERVALRLGARRRARSRVIAGLALLATVVALFFLATILITLLYLGLGGLRLSVFTHVTLPPGSGGGLLNAIVGSIVQTLLGVAIGTPIGLAVGTFLAEYARTSALGNAVRFVSDVLLSAPSILIGLFVYVLLVEPFNGFSAFAGAIALAIIVIPIVVRTTEDMLLLVPDTLREASIALGAPKWKSIRLCRRAARDGITTGVLLAVARVAGETAPLLFTSLGNNNWSIFTGVDWSHVTLRTFPSAMFAWLGLGAPMSSLPVTIYQYAGSAYSDWVQLAWTGALLITAGVLVINIVARIALRGRAPGGR